MPEMVVLEWGPVEACWVVAEQHLPVALLEGLLVEGLLLVLLGQGGSLGLRRRHLLGVLLAEEFEGVLEDLERFLILGVAHSRQHRLRYVRHVGHRSSFHRWTDGFVRPDWKWLIEHRVLPLSRCSRY